MLAFITDIAWWTSFPSLVTHCVSFPNCLRLYFFLTAAACPVLVLLGGLVGRCRQDSLLLWLVLAAGGADTVAWAFILALVLCAGASTLIGVAACSAARLLNRSRRFVLIGDWMLRCIGGAAATLGSEC